MVALNDNPARKPKASSQRKVSAQSADRLSFMPDVYPENIGMPLANPAAAQLPDGTSDYIWQGSQVIEERNSSNAAIRQYVWGTYPGAAALTGPPAQTGFRPQNTGLGSLNVDECVQLTTLTTLGPQSLPAGAYYLLQDLPYRAVALTNSSGTVVEAYDTDAYGNTLIFTAPGAIVVLRQEPKSRLSTGVANREFTDDDVQSSYGANEIIYCGYPNYGIVIMVIGTGLYDPETDLYYVRNRMYNPARYTVLRRELKSRNVVGGTTREIQRDPIGYAGGVNLYEYVGGRAALALDPTGNQGAGVLAAPPLGVRPAMPNYQHTCKTATAGYAKECKSQSSACNCPTRPWPCCAAMVSKFICGGIGLLTPFPGAPPIPPPLPIPMPFDIPAQACFLGCVNWCLYQHWQNKSTPAWGAARGICGKRGNCSSQCCDTSVMAEQIGLTSCALSCAGPCGITDPGTILHIINNLQDWFHYGFSLCCGIAK